MDIKLISISNDKYLSSNSIGIGIISEYLRVNGHKAECLNYYMNMASRYNLIEYADYVAEMADMVNILQIIKNYREGNSNLVEKIDTLSSSQLRMVEEVVKSVSEMKIKDGTIFGFSVTYLSYFYSVIYALLIRRKNPNVKIVFGGYQMTLSKKCCEFSIKSGIVDIAVMGDGCQPMLDIARGKIKKGCVSGLFKKSITWPNYTKVHAHLGNYSLATLTSVGCPANCFFCASKRKHILYDLSRFVEYAKKLKENTKIKVLQLVDDEINPTTKRGIDVCGAMKSINIDWDCFLTPINVSRTFARALQDSRCKRVFFGAETFSDARLRSLNKATTSAKTIKVIELLAGHGMMIFFLLICGLPGETEREYKQNLKICIDLKKRYGKLIKIKPTCFKVFPGSHHYVYPKNFGIRFNYWDDKYANIFPELRDIIKKIPKRFKVKDISNSISRSKVDEIRNFFPLTGIKDTATADEDRKIILNIIKRET